MTDKDHLRHQEVALEARETAGKRLFSPSVARNRDAIRDVFISHMPTKGQILEIGGGTGEHAVHIAAALPDINWLTGDPDQTSRQSIAAWIAETAVPNLQGPHAIDVAAKDWDVETDSLFNGLISINMVHIAPFAAAEGLFAGAGRLLATDGKLFLYGPFSRKGVHTAPSNEAFDAHLKSRNADWGVRDIEHDLAPLAQKNALILEAIVEMPANNLSVIFRKT